MDSKFQYAGTVKSVNLVIASFLCRPLASVGSNRASDAPGPGRSGRASIAVVLTRRLQLTATSEPDQAACLHRRRLSRNRLAPEPDPRRVVFPPVHRPGLRPSLKRSTPPKQSESGLLTPRTEIAITDKPGSYGSGFPASCSGPNFGEAVGLRFGLPPYGKTPSTPKMRCVAYLSPIATACL